MTEAFILRALAAGIGVAVIAGVLGCFVVWRRMAYFGDSLSHSALLGVALGLITGVGSTIGVVAVCAIFSGLLVWLRQQRTLAADTLLGVLAHSALAAGIMAFSFFDGPPVRLYGYLFGDILVVSNNQLLWVYAGGIAVLTLLIANWQMLTLTAIHEDLAASEGINPLHANLLLMLLMTIVVAISIRIVGALLITSLLIIPAATARQFAKSPTSMAAIAAAVGVLAVIGGLTMSLHIDTPAGPSIVSAAALMFAVTFPLSQRSQ